MSKEHLGVLLRNKRNGRQALCRTVLPFEEKTESEKVLFQCSRITESRGATREIQETKSWTAQDLDVFDGAKGIYDVIGLGLGGSRISDATLFNVTLKWPSGALAPRKDYPDVVDEVFES